MPITRAAASPGIISGPPGLGTIKSWSTKVCALWPPSSSVTPAARSFAAVSAICDSGRSSVAVTRAPRAAQKSAVAMPVRANPTTSTCLPASSIPGFNSLPQFQRRQRKQREDQRRDPEPHDNFRFAPSSQLEMMVQRRHAEDALTRQAERGHLQNHRKRFQHEHAANKKQKDFLLDGHRHHPDGTAERERSDVAHEHFGGMRVVPEKSERGAHQGSAKNRQLPHVRKML